MKIIFYGPKGIKAIWKIAIAFAVYFAVSVLSLLTAVFIFNLNNITNFNEMVTKTMDSSWGNALQSGLSILFISLVCYFVVKKNLILKEELGVNGTFLSALKKSAIGFFIGMFLIAVEIAVLLIFDQAEFLGYNSDVNHMIILFSGLIIFAGIALAEEITFRGYIQNILSGKNEIFGIVVTSALFALMHLVNSSYSLLSLIYLFISGAILSLMRILSHGLWLPIGFHLAWNLTESTVFGLNEQGNKHLLYNSTSKSTVWNGGTSGSGLVQIFILCSMLVLLIICYIKHKKNGDKNILD